MEAMDPHAKSSDRLRGVETFVQVMEAGSFAAAAARLRMTRSAVGKSIARLETRLGVQLFARTTRRLSATDAGLAYHERCRRALAELAAAEDELAAGHAGPRGRLRVSLPRALGRHGMAPILSALALAHDALSIELRFDDRTVDVLGEQFDLAVRIGALPDRAGLQARRLGTQRFQMFAAPVYLRRHGRPPSIDALRQHVAIAYAAPERAPAWRLPGADGRPQEVHVQRLLAFDDLDAIADAALAGLGVARLPWWLVHRWVEAGRLEPILQAHYGEDSDVHALWPRTRFMAPKLRAAIDALARGAPAVLVTAGRGG